MSKKPILQLISVNDGITNCYGLKKINDSFMFFYYDKFNTYKSKYIIFRNKKYNFGYILLR